MSLNDEVELLRQVPIFANIEPAKLKLLAFTSERLTFRKGLDLCVQGDPGDAAFIIIEGEADIIINMDNGDSKTVSKIGKHQIVGEISILCDVPRTATVRASSDVVVLRISKDLFFRLVSEFPQMAVQILRELAARLESTTAQLAKSLGNN